MADNGKTARSGGRESLRKVSISRIKKEMSDVFYLSDDLVISALTADKNTTPIIRPRSTALRPSL